MEIKRDNTKQKFINSVLNVIYPDNFCPICDTAVNKGDVICSDCRKKFIIDYTNGLHCFHCGRVLEDGGTCGDCIKDSALKGSRAAMYYNEEVRSAIYGFKYSNKLYLGRKFADIMSENLEDWIRQGDILIEIPIHKERIKVRRYNQSEIIAGHISKNLNIRYSSDILKRQKNTSALSGIGLKEDRKKEIENAFAVVKKNEIKNKAVMIVDDILTTSATINEAAKILMEEGAKEVFAVTLAVGQVIKV